MKIRLLKINVDLINIKEVVEQIYYWCGVKGSHYICVSNVHMCMEAFDDQSMERVVNNADFVVPDGKPLVWGQKLLGHKDAQQVRGQDLTIALCQLASEKKLKVGFYGGEAKTLLALKKKLLQEFPDLKIAYDYSPPFRSLTTGENSVVIDAINAAGVHILFVGIGCPKQERWMAKNKDQLNCVMLGVGAAFDFIAGNKKHAPLWVQEAGLEWLFRLVKEPRRLWKRYLKQNPRFIWYFSQQLVRRKF